MTTEPHTPLPWEMFCDESYYDLWCVRPTGSKTFGAGFHMNSHEEAVGLCDLLNKNHQACNAYPVLVEALKAVTDATCAYLPPDGISEKECIQRIIAATDNPKINAVMGMLK